MQNNKSSNNARWQLRVIATFAALSLPFATMATDSDYAWLAGNWCSVSGERVIEEIWLPVSGTIMLGVGHTHSSGRSVDFEFMRIAELDGIDNFIAQPGGGTPVYFRRTTGGDNWARFENPAHDFPQRVEYRREGDRLLAEVAGPGNNGKEKTIVFVYLACQ